MMMAVIIMMTIKAMITFCSIMHSKKTTNINYCTNRNGEGTQGHRMSTFTGTYTVT